MAPAEQAILTQLTSSVAPRTEPASAVTSEDIADRLREAAITLPQLLRHHAITRGNRLALREKEHGIWKPYDWSHYYSIARQFAFGLLAVGVQRGDRVAIASENTPEWYYADLGAQMIGAIVVGIYPTNPWPELQYIVRHSGARVIVTGDQEQTDKVFDAMANGDGLPAVEAVVCVDMKGLRNYTQDKLTSFAAICERGRAFATQRSRADAELDAMIDGGRPDDTAIMVYTSGTTGPPKGAMLSHRNLVYAAYQYVVTTDTIDRPYEAVCYLPLCHVAERCYSCVTQLVVGGTVSFAESIDTVAVNIREIAPTFFIGVPRIYEKLQQNFMFRLGESGRIRRSLTQWALAQGRILSDRRDKNAGRADFSDQAMFALLYVLVFRNMQRHLGLNRSRHRLCAGASISPEMLRFFDIIGLPVSQGFGLTETAGVGFVQHGAYHRIGGCGLPLPGTEWRQDADGEILMKSPAIFKGYFLDESASTASVENGGWLRTGDIVEVLDNGEIAVIDRKKAIIITAGGKNIAPSEVENALKDSEYIKEAIVVGEARKFLGALIQIDYEHVGRWATEQALTYTNYKSLSQLPEVRNLLDIVVNAVNKRFARVENIRRFVILEKELDHDDGELTATQKVRRSTIEKKFARELDLIYGAA